MEEKQEKSKYSYETLWKMIIRPPRDNYTEQSLGNSILLFKGRFIYEK